MRSSLSALQVANFSNCQSHRSSTRFGISRPKKLAFRTLTVLMICASFTGTQSNTQKKIKKYFTLNIQMFVLISTATLRTYTDAQRSIACDSIPLIFCGLRLQRNTPSLSCNFSIGTKPARPLTTVRGTGSPRSTVST